MGVVFSEEYQARFSKIVDTVEVLQAVEHPDRRSSHESGDRTWEMFAKKFARDKESPHYVWVLCLTAGDSYEVNHALVIPLALDENIDSMAPGEMLRLFLGQFGSAARSSLRVGKFTDYEISWANENPSPEFLVASDPQKGETLLGWSTVKLNSSCYRVESRVYAIDMQKYTDYLRDDQHEIRGC
jgi:hypothetical protein